MYLVMCTCCTGVWRLEVNICHLQKFTTSLFETKSLTEAWTHGLCSYTGWSRRLQNTLVPTFLALLLWVWTEWIVGAGYQTQILRVWCHTSLISGFSRQSQINLSEIEADLVYIPSSRPAGGTGWSSFRPTLIVKAKAKANLGTHVQMWSTLPTEKSA